MRIQLLVFSFSLLILLSVFDSEIVEGGLVARLFVRQTVALYMVGVVGQVYLGLVIDAALHLHRLLLAEHIKQSLYMRFAVHIKIDLPLQRYTLFPNNQNVGTIFFVYVRKVSGERDAQSSAAIALRATQSARLMCRFPLS